MVLLWKKREEWTRAMQCGLSFQSLQSDILAGERPSGGFDERIAEDVNLHLVRERGELGQRRAQVVGGLAPLRRGGRGVVLGERGGDEGGDDGRPLFPAWASALRIKWMRGRSAAKPII
jgi:hypothetical protein